LSAGRIYEEYLFISSGFLITLRWEFLASST
jgi:hypothetical protein